jgi:hypothetical protein
MFDCIQLVYIEGIKHTRPGDYFVDDTTTGTTNNDVSSVPVNAIEQELTEEEEQLVAKMEEIIKFFLDCLQVTGGRPGAYQVRKISDQPPVERWHPKAPTPQPETPRDQDSVKINWHYRRYQAQCTKLGAPNPQVPPGGLRNIDRT